MTITLDNKQGLIAGDGILPIKMAQYAKENGVYPSVEVCCDYFVKCLDSQEFESKEERENFEERGKK